MDQDEPVYMYFRWTAYIFCYDTNGQLLWSKLIPKKQPIARIWSPGVGGSRMVSPQGKLIVLHSAHKEQFSEPLDISTKAVAGPDHCNVMRTTFNLETGQQTSKLLWPDDTYGYALWTQTKPLLLNDHAYFYISMRVKGVRLARMAMP